MPQTAENQTWSPLIVCPHAGMSDRIRAALTDLGASGARHLAEYPRLGAIAGLAAQQGANVCFLDVATDPDHALALIGEVAPVAPVVALNPHNDADLILRCLRRGASEFLSDPSKEQVAAVLDHLHRSRNPAERRKQARVYSVVPGKGGSGASTLAVQLAIEMKRQGAERVLLADTDVIAGTIAFLLKLKPEFHLGDAVRDRSRMDTDLWDRLTIQSNGADILAAPENPATPIEMSRQVSLDLMAFWREHYDAVVLDTPGAHSPGLEMALLSDEILLVTTNEVASVYAARRAMEYLVQNGAEAQRLRLVVNRFTPAGLKRAEVAAALKVEPFAVLCEDAGAVGEAALNGKPVAAGSRWGRAAEALAAQLAGTGKPAGKRRSFFGLVSGKK